MSTLTRRSLLGATAAALSLPALAAQDPQLARVATWRERWAEDEQEILREMLPEGPLPRGDARAEEAQALARGLSALGAVKALHAVSPDDQRHPEIQRFGAEAAEAFGDALLRTRDLVAAHFTERGAHAELLLRGALRTIRVGVTERTKDPTRDGLLLGSLEALEARPERGVLRAELRRTHRKLGRLDALVQRAIAEGRGLDLVRGPTTAGAEDLDERVLRGLRIATEPVNHKRLFGMILLGAVFVAGCFLFLTGTCNMVCGNPTGAIFAVAGLGLVLLSFWGAVHIGSAMGDAVTPSFPRPGEFPDDEETPAKPPEGSMLLYPELGWQAAGWRGGRVRAFGRVRSPGGWLVDAAGEGEAGADSPLPGAPLGALLARVGGQVLALGAEGLLPDVAGLELALNLPSKAQTHARGFLFLLHAT